MMRRSLPPLFTWWKLKNIWFVFFICLAMLNITACDYINNKLYPNFKANSVKSVVDKPPFARQNKSPNISIEKIRDIADSNSMNNEDFTVNSVALKNDIANSKGLKTNQLFADAVKTDEERFARIEARVQKIADTLNKMSPAITKLIGIESELDSLTFQLEELINKGNLDSLVEEKNEAIKTTKNKHTPIVRKPNATKASQKTTNQKASTGNSIYKIRLGDHPDKTRIVFETAKKLDYTISIDNDEKIMTIAFPKGSLSTNPNNVSHQSNIIKSITQNIEGDGSIIAFELTHSTQKPKTFHIPPSAELARHRIVIDIKR